MEKLVPFTYEDFERSLVILGANSITDKQFVYSIYSYTINGIAELNKNDFFGNLHGINHLEVIGYCVGEYAYLVSGMDRKQIDIIINKEKTVASISSMVADKYLSLNKFSYKEQSLANRFAPPISTLYVYINFMLNVVQVKNKKDPKTSLIVDLFMKSISICKCTLDLLINGFETEAFSTWRTLHECECTLLILAKYGEQASKAYLKHMQYSLAFRDTLTNKDRQTEIFNAMKDEMKQYNLKSKDIKKYIEYGWLYSIDDFKDYETYKLNFRDGLEKAAGLSVYNKRYEMSSEIIHGTPLLVYSSREYFYFVTILSTYESFIRLENLFSNVFSKIVHDEQLEGYLQMRKVYYSQIVSIHQKESEKFKIWQKYQTRQQAKNE